MHTLIAIPALGCDEKLYEKIAAGLGDLVSLRTIMADKGRLAACVEQVLDGAPEQFIILGTSFGGRVAMEAAVAAPGRVKGLVVIGSSAGPSPDRAAGLRRSERLRVRDGDRRNGGDDRASAGTPWTGDARGLHRHGAPAGA